MATDGIIDLRSDTVTQPTEEMRRAMAEARVGDDVYEEDPTVNELQHYAAALFDRQAALFVPSGTMGNQIAVRLHTSPGQEVITDHRGHVYNYELAAMASISGVLARSVDSQTGYLTWDQIEPAIAPKVYYRAQTALIVLENTHNMAGGVIYPPAVFEEVCVRAHEAGLKVHLDGARIFNAAVASRSSVATLARGCDSVMICLSKGLCAPAGSLLLGDSSLIRRARIVRKMLGGGMRQAGVLAAAGLVALQRMVDRLEEDHANARLLARLLSSIRGLAVAPAEIPTNILIINTAGADWDAHELAKRLEKEGIKIGALDSRNLRALTHRDIDRDDIQITYEIFRRLVG